MITFPVALLALPLWLAFLHWFGDFALQSRFIADKKSKRNDILLLHVAMVTVVLGVGMAVWTSVGLPFEYPLTFVLTNGVLHFITDYITSRATSRYYTDGNIRAFFTTIGADQWLCHFPALYMTAVWLCH